MKIPCPNPAENPISPPPPKPPSPKTPSPKSKLFLTWILSIITATLLGFTSAKIHSAYSHKPTITEIPDINCNI